MQHKYDGDLKREKLGMHEFTSLGLFTDDVERLLRDLFGELDNWAIDRIRSAVSVIVEEFTRHVRTDLCKEHEDAWNIDYVLGIGVPEGCGVHGHDHSKANVAAHDIAVRARAVRANQTAFSKYTVEFVKVLDMEWPALDDAADTASACTNAKPPEDKDVEVRIASFL
jgi:hypothetical protein